MRAVFNPVAILVELIHDMKQKYPNVELRPVAVDLSSANPEDYMKKIMEATKDIEVQLVFNNAG